MAKNASESFIAIAHGLERVSNVIAEFGLVESGFLRDQYPATENLQNSMVKLYTSIFVYLANAARFYNRNSFMRFARGIVNKDRDAVEKSLERIKEKQKQQETSNSSLHMKISKVIWAHWLRRYIHILRGSQCPVALF